jgi:RluA family pseudouridine synthase
VRKLDVLDSEHRLRIDRYLKKRLAEVGRGRILEWLRGGLVRINGRPVPGEGYYVKRGDRVEWPDGPPAHLQRPAGGSGPGEAPMDEPEWPPVVLYDDRDLLIISKPFGVPTNPSPAAGRGNVLSLLERTAGRLHLVHRLDRDTSGALILARNARSRDRLLAAFRARRVEKKYVAVVAGRVRAPAGSLTARLLEHPRRSNRRIETVRKGGLEARTDYRVLERFQTATRLEVQARSGRMHQVRAHLAAMGHPILGDRIYGRPHSSRPPRLCLHALRLELPHPRTGAPLQVEAPLPTDLAEFLERLRLGAGSPRARSRTMEERV